jgi:hypothetical protein
MHYQERCSDKEYNVIQLIEPLIDFIRDPLKMCRGISSIPSNLYLDVELAYQSKRFLLLVLSSSFQIEPPLSSNIPSIPLWLYSIDSKKFLLISEVRNW